MDGMEAVPQFIEVELTPMVPTPAPVRCKACRSSGQITMHASRPTKPIRCVWCKGWGWLRTR